MSLRSDWTHSRRAGCLGRWSDGLDGDDRDSFESKYGLTVNTDITRMLGIRYPIVLPQMTRVATPPLVAAVSEAGGLGVLATASLGPVATRDAIREVRRRTQAPFGVGVALLAPGGRENAEVALAEKVGVIVFSLGKGDWLVPAAHEFGGRVVATVTTERHARAAERQGCDAVQVVGHEAAGHGSAIASMVLIPTIRDAIEIPIIAAGGFADGRGLVAALALGASAVAMGTRFAVAAESPLHARTKASVLELSADDTMYGDEFDGMDSRVLRTDHTQRLASEKPGLWNALRASRPLAQELGVPWPQLVGRVLARGPVRTLQLARMAGSQLAMKRAIEDGDLEHGIQPIGQAQGLIKDAPPVAELMRRILAEAADSAAAVEDAGSRRR